MENFKLTQEEKNRILNLHENFIKEQMAGAGDPNDYVSSLINQTTQQVQPTPQPQPQPQPTQQAQPTPQPQPQTQIVPGEKIVPGVYNATVKLLQDKLNEKYQTGLSPDGKLGPKTMAALENVLKQKGITLAQLQAQPQQQAFKPSDTLANG